MVGYVPSYSIFQHDVVGRYSLTVTAKSRASCEEARFFYVRWDGDLTVLAAHIARLPGATYEPQFRRWRVPPTVGNAIALQRFADTWRALVYPVPRHWMAELAARPE